MTINLAAFDGAQIPVQRVMLAPRKRHGSELNFVLNLPAGASVEYFADATTPFATCVFLMDLLSYWVRDKGLAYASVQSLTPQIGGDTALKLACANAGLSIGTSFDVGALADALRKFARDAIHDPDIALALGEVGISRSLIERVLDINRGAKLVGIIAKQALAFTAPGYDALTVSGQ